MATSMAVFRKLSFFYAQFLFLKFFKGEPPVLRNFFSEKEEAATLHAIVKSCLILSRVLLLKSTSDQCNKASDSCFFFSFIKNNHQV